MKQFWQIKEVYKDSTEFDDIIRESEILGLPIDRSDLENNDIEIEKLNIGKVCIDVTDISFCIEVIKDCSLIAEESKELLRLLHKKDIRYVPTLTIFFKNGVALTNVLGGIEKIININEKRI